MLKVEIAVAKSPKYAARESGDSVEVVERPNGGISVVVADGQRSGQSAKHISNIAVRKAVSLLAEGVRDGAVARAAHDYLRTFRRGQVSSELIIVSADFETRSLVISRNTRCPVLLVEGADLRVLDEVSEVVGVHERIRPVITELPLATGLTVIAFTDGLTHAGERYGQPMDLMATVRQAMAVQEHSAQAVADQLLAAATALDQGRPVDDTSVVVLKVTSLATDEAADVRRMSVSFPVPPP